MAAAVVLGLGLPVMMAPASKSSPLMLGIAAVLAFAAAALLRGPASIAADARAAVASRTGLAGLAMLALMAASIPFAHAPRASALQFAQFVGAIAAGFMLALCFPAVTPRRRAFLFAAGAALAAGIMLADLLGGLWLRSATGGRATSYTYNRGLVTLALMAWPLFALLLSARKLWLIPPVAGFLGFAIAQGDSGAAVVAALAGLVVFPVAALLPRFTRWAGLAGTLALLAVQPWFGMLMDRLLSQSLHQRLEGMHTSDRVQIWLSFEAAARAKLLTGNGFGSSLNLQNGPVAALIPPERVTMLGASHPHNAFLQVWVELGLVGFVLAAMLMTLVFNAIGRMRPALQPFALTCLAATLVVALVSHGAWQAWWWAAIMVCITGFVTLEGELRRGEPPL